jgi:hypothetical protein
MTLEELGHPQPKTQIRCNNATTISIANNTVKRQRLQSMEMRYLWVCDKIAQDAYSVKWHPGQENLADYQSKYHLGPYHQAVCPWYQHDKHSPLVLPQATPPSTLKECVGTLPEGYKCNVPLPRVLPAERTSTRELPAQRTSTRESLPRVPILQSTSSETRHQVHTIPDYYKGMYIVPTYNSPCSIFERAAFAFS